VPEGAPGGGEGEREIESEERERERQMGGREPTWGVLYFT